MAFQAGAFQASAFQISAPVEVRGPFAIAVQLAGSTLIMSRVVPVIVLEVTAVTPVTIEVTPMARLYFGQRTQITATFSEDGEAFNPDEVRFTLLKPDGSLLVNPDGITSPGTGVRAYELVLNQTGTYRWRWESTGAGEESALEGSFTVPVPLT